MELPFGRYKALGFLTEMIPASTGTRAVNINTVTCGDSRPHILLACAAGNFDIATQGLRVSTFRKSKLKICQVPGDQKAPKALMWRCVSFILIFLHIHFPFPAFATDAILFLQLD